MQSEVEPSTNGQQLLAVSLEAAERQVLELQCTLEECGKKLRAAELRVLDLTKVNLQQQKELIASTSRIFTLEQRLKLNGSGSQKRTFETRRCENEFQALQLGWTQPVGSLSNTEDDDLESLDQNHCTPPQTSALTQQQDLPFSRRPFSAGSAPLGLEESLCNMSSPQHQPWRLKLRSSSATFRNCKPRLTSATKPVSTGRQMRYAEDQENVDPSSPEQEPLLVTGPTQDPSSFGKHTRFHNADRGHISPSSAGKKVVGAQARRNLAMILTPDFGPLGHAQQFWQENTRPQLPSGGLWSPIMRERQPLSPL